MRNTLSAAQQLNAYLYSRVSTGSQRSGTGLSRQSERGLAICREHNWNLMDDDLRDVGSAYSGKNMLEGNLGRFITAAKEGRLRMPAVLVLEQWDRFSRQELDTSFDAARNLLKTGVAIHIGLQGGRTFTKSDLNDMASRIAMEISMQQAWEYSHNLSHRVNAAFKAKYAHAAEGRAVPLGYWQPTWVNYVGPKKGTGRFELNATADVVRDVVRRYLDGLSMMRIANGLNAEQVPCIGRGNKKGRQWTQGSVRYLLTSPSLVGTITIVETNGQRVEHTFPHYYPRLISDRQWTLLQNKLAENKGRRGSRDGDWISTLFRNRTRCSCCGGAATTANAIIRGVAQRYYKCQTARLNRKKCNVREMVSIAQVEEDFFVQVLKEHPVIVLSKSAVKCNEEIAGLKHRLRDLDKAITEGAQLLGKIPITALEAQLGALKKQRDAAAKELEQANARLLSTATAPAALESLKATLTAAVNLPGGYADFESSNREDATVRTYEKLRAQLANPATRQRLVDLLPSLVDHLVIDFKARTYRVVQLGGATSKWFTLPPRVGPSRVPQTTRA